MDKNTNQDKGLQGNEKIEQAIEALQQEATQELLAHALTVITQTNERRRSVYSCGRTTNRR